MRVWSPSSGSTLMISAPWSASSMVQNGPANICVRSTMRTPSRAPRTLIAGSAPPQWGPCSARGGVAGLQHLAVTIERIAVIEGPLQPDLVHAEFHQRILGRVLGGEPDAHRDGDAAEAQPLAVVRALGQVLVEVRLGRVHGHVGDPDLLHRLDGLSARMLQHVTDL